MSDMATVLVTGGAGHLGRPIVQALAARGFRTAVNDIDDTALHRLSGDVGEAVPFPADVSDERAAARLVTDVAHRLGSIDVLVNAVGVEGPIGPIESVEPISVRRTFDANVMTMIWTTRAVVPLMKRAGRGRIINMASGAGLAGGALASVYHATKHAVVGLTRSLARELAPHGIGVNAVCPGYVDSPMVDRILDAQAAVTGSMVDVDASIPIGRKAAPHEVASTVAYLAVDAPDYLTGTCLVLDGGLRA